MLGRRVAVLATVSILAVACATTPPAAGTSPPVPSAIQPVESSDASSRPSLADALRVVGLALQADPAKVTGACPVEITFTGRITIAGGSGTVSYRWVSSDGDESPIKTATFDGPGSQDVSSTWTVDSHTLPSREGWSSIEITDPINASASGASTARAGFAFACNDDDGLETIGFGIGGSDCSLGKPARTFATTDKIWVVADYSPSLRAGTVVTFNLTHDGIPVDGYPLKITLDVVTKCVHGTVSPGVLPAGHYRLDVVPDTARPVSGEFDTK